METTIIHQSLFFPLPPSFPSLLPIPFPEIYYSHSVIYFLQTCRKRPLPVLTELAGSQGFNDWGLVQWREEKPGAQLEYTPHPRGSRTDDSYTHYPPTLHTTYHPFHVIPPVLLYLSCFPCLSLFTLCFFCSFCPCFLPFTLSHIHTQTSSCSLASSSPSPLYLSFLLPFLFLLFSLSPLPPYPPLPSLFHILSTPPLT